MSLAAPLHYVPHVLLRVRVRVHAQLRCFQFILVHCLWLFH